MEQTRESAEDIRILLAVKMDIKFEAISIELQRIQSQTHRNTLGIPKNIFIYLSSFHHEIKTILLTFHEVLKSKGMIIFDAYLPVFYFPIYHSYDVPVPVIRSAVCSDLCRA